MKKVAIITIEDYTNYGNRLQNYALTKLLEENNIQVVNGLKIFTKTSWIRETDNIIKKMIKFFTPYSFSYKIFQKEETLNELKKKRFINFKKFVDMYSSPLGVIYAKNDKIVKEKLRQYNIDYYIVGSDQVWNPYFEGKEYEFLTFIEKEKRLSFAASFGVDSIPLKKEKRFKKNISEMKYLSVREKSGVELIKKITGRDADFTLDPTLLLDIEKWNILLEKTKIKIPEKYICTYFLGKIPEEIIQFASKKELKILSLNDVESPDWFVIDPISFLYVIKNAEYVITDSFHAVAFSIKFHKQFYVYKRKLEGGNNMFTRLESILEKVQLSERIQEGYINEISDIQDKKWEKIDVLLRKEKESSMKKLIEQIL